MNIFEFTDRTGYQPTEDQFTEIHKEYMKAGESVDKDTFCKSWKKNGGILKASQEAQREIWMLTGARDKAVDMACTNINKAGKLQNQNNELQRELLEAKRRIKELEAKLEAITNIINQ